MFLTTQGRRVMKTGPNDASGVVWAIGKFFFFFLGFMNTNYYIQIRMGWFREGSDDENKWL